MDDVEVVGIVVRDAQGALHAAQAEYWWDGDEAVVTVTAGAAAWTGRSGASVFDALIDVRRQCEPLGYRLICWGASRDVRPSGMQRDFGGTSAYRMRMGLKPSLEDVVDIFAMDDAVDPATVEEQSE